MGEPARGVSAESAIQGDVGKPGGEKGKSMEDILSSIRKIIASETEQAKAQEATKEAKSPVEEKRGELLSGLRKSADKAEPEISTEPEKPAVTEKPTASAGGDDMGQGPVAEAPSATPGGLAALAARVRSDAKHRPNDLSANKSAERMPAPTSTSTPNPTPALNRDPARAPAIAPKPADPVVPEATLKAASSPNAGEQKPASLREIAENALKAKTERAVPEKAEISESSAGVSQGEAGNGNASGETPEPETPQAETEARPSSVIDTKSGDDPIASASGSRDGEQAGAKTGAEKPTQSRTADEPAEFREALVSPSTQAAVASSMDRLKKSVEDVDAARVEAVLRPLLKGWLDKNLPELVERMVQEEIDAISKRD